MALVAPLRRRVRGQVDRRFNRDLLAVADRTMRPTRTSLWLRPYRR